MSATAFPPLSLSRAQILPSGAGRTSVTPYHSPGENAGAREGGPSYLAQEPASGSHFLTPSRSVYVGAGVIPPAPA